VNYHRIRLGMNRSEVESILGAQPGYYVTARISGLFGLTESEGDVVSMDVERADYESNSVLVSVIYDQSGHVCQKTCCENILVDQSLLENLTWRINRQWRRMFPSDGECGAP
jgi:hypothetical protein